MSMELENRESTIKKEERDQSRLEKQLKQLVEERMEQIKAVASKISISEKSDFRVNRSHLDRAKNWTWTKSSVLMNPDSCMTMKIQLHTRHFDNQERELGMQINELSEAFTRGDTRAAQNERLLLRVLIQILVGFSIKTRLF